MLFESYINDHNKQMELFESFDNYVIQEFNPTLRNQLITKWYRLGKEYLDTKEKNDFFHKVDLATENINTIIGRNLIPSYPVFLLTILQTLELGQTDNTTNSLHAYYYEYLITKSLKRSLDDIEDIGFYMTLSKEYFYFLFTEKIRFKPLNKSDFEKFLERHAKKYDLKRIDTEKIMKILTDSRILKMEDDSISITYKYLYYFFVAKYFSDNIDDSEIKRYIDLMADRLYRDEYSNIILFLTHLTKNNYIITKLVEKSKNLFQEFEPFRLEKDVDFIMHYRKRFL